MSFTTRSVSTTICDRQGCTEKWESGDFGNRGELEGWGVIAVKDGVYHHDVIGDQNGWNNYDLCPAHYKAIADMLGVELE